MIRHQGVRTAIRETVSFRPVPRNPIPTSASPARAIDSATLPRRRAGAHDTGLSAYFTCAICQRVSALADAEFKCPFCGSYSGEYTSELPEIPKGMIRPSLDIHARRDPGRPAS